MAAGDDVPELSPVFLCRVGPEGMEENSEDAVESHKYTEYILACYMGIPGYVTGPNEAENPSNREDDGENTSRENVAPEV